MMVSTSQPDAASPAAESSLDPTIAPSAVQAEMAVGVTLPVPANAADTPEGLAGTSDATNTVTPAETDAQALARLATLSQMEFDRVRKAEAKALGIQLSTLDEQVKAARAAPAPVELLPFQDWEPYPEPVDPALLLTEIAATIRSMVILDPEQADAGALWVAHTHVADVADTSPIAIVNAPEKACAKTLLQTVFAKMSKRPLQASNASLSALFRAVESWQSTLFIDEADTFFKDNPELHGLVNAGYSKGGFVLRSEASGDSFEPRMFSVYGPKSIAGIALEKHLPDSTMSRGIIFNLRRKLPHESVQRLRHFDKSVFERIGSKLARFAQDYSQQLRLARPDLPEELSDREQDSWEALFAIAQCAGPDWVERANKAALALSGESLSSVSTGNELLADIQSVFEIKRTFKISTVDLIDALTADEERGWATYNRGKQLSPRQLAKQLAAYGIHSKTVRMPTGSTPKGYDADQFADAFARYLSIPPKLPQQGNAATQPMQGMEAPVADTTQQSDADALDPFLADPGSMGGAAAEGLPGVDCGAVADTTRERKNQKPPRTMAELDWNR